MSGDIIMYMNSNDEVKGHYLENPIEQLQIDISSKQQKWQSDGLKISEEIKGISQYYNQKNNKILKLLQLDNYLIVTDQIGTIRVFNYPCSTDLETEVYECYCDHLNQITKCVANPESTKMATISEIDKCVIIWDIFRPDEQQGSDDSQENILQIQK